MKRLYLFCITDGVSEVKAMEYHRIPSLDFDIQPGMKVIDKNLYKNVAF